MDEWYGHQGTVTLCMTKLPSDWVVDRTYESRGWVAPQRPEPVRSAGHATCTRLTV